MTTVKKHSRKGTKGVKRHTRNTAKKKVPHTVQKQQITVDKLIKDLNLEITNFSFFDSKTGKHEILKDFNDLPEELRKKKWDFEVEVDRTPVDDSIEYAYINIKGHRVTGKERKAKRTGINLSSMKLQPTGYEMVDTFQTIGLDTHMNNPIYDDDEESKDQIRRSVKKTLQSNFNVDWLNYRWEK